MSEELCRWNWNRQAYQRLEICFIRSGDQVRSNKVEVEKLVSSLISWSPLSESRPCPIQVRTIFPARSRIKFNPARHRSFASIRIGVQFTIQTDGQARVRRCNLRAPVLEKNSRRSSESRTGRHWQLRNPPLFIVHDNALNQSSPFHRVRCTHGNTQRRGEEKTINLRSCLRAIFKLSLSSSQSPPRTVVRRDRCVCFSSRSAAKCVNKCTADRKAMAIDAEKVKNCVKTYSLTAFTLLGVLGGVALGFGLRSLDRERWWTKREVMYVQFIGDVYLRMLNGLILPFMVSAIISAVGSLELKTSWRIGLRSVAW